MFNYLGEYFQLPWGVFSTTLGGIFSYPGQYFQEMTPFFTGGMFSGDLEARPQMLSKVSVLGEAVRKKSEQHRARTPERFSRDVFYFFSV